MYRHLALTLTTLLLCSSRGQSASLIQSEATYAVTVTSEEAGIKVALVSPSGNRSSLQIDGYSLSSECLTSSHRCNVTAQSNGTTASVLVPLDRGVAYITYSYDSDEGRLLYRDSYIIHVNRRCAPISLSFAGKATAFLLCVNVTDNAPVIDFMNLDLGGGQYAASYLDTWNIQNTDYFSESVYIPDQVNCPNINPDISNNIFVMDDLKAVAFVTNSGYTMASLNVLPPSVGPYCPAFLRLEYYGKNKAIMRCSPSSGIVLSLCTNDAVAYDGTGGIPYPCSDWDTVITLHSNGSLHISSLPSISITLPYAIADALCIHGSNPVFVFGLENGTVLALAVRDREMMEVTRYAVPRQGRWFLWSADPSIVKMADGQIFIIEEKTALGHIYIKNLTHGGANLSTCFKAFYTTSAVQEVTKFDLPSTPAAHIIIVSAVIPIVVVATAIITGIIYASRKKIRSHKHTDGRRVNSQQSTGTSQETQKTDLCSHEGDQPSFDSGSHVLSTDHIPCDLKNDNPNAMYGNLSASCEPCPSSDETNDGVLANGNSLPVVPTMIGPVDVANQNRWRTGTEDMHNDLLNKATNIM